MSFNPLCYIGIYILKFSSDKSTKNKNKHQIYYAPEKEKY